MIEMSKLEQLLIVQKIKNTIKAYNATPDSKEKYWLDAELEVLTHELERVDRTLKKCENCKGCGNTIEKREKEDETISFNDAINYIASHSKGMNAAEFEKMKNKVMNLVSQKDKNRLGILYQRFFGSVL